MSPQIAVNTAVTRDELLDFIRPRHHAIVITARADGRPQASPVTCGVDAEGRIVVATYPERAKTRNARRNEQVSVLVLSDDFGGAWVQVDGTAEVLDVPEAVEPLVEYFRSISGEHPDWDEYRQAMVRQGKSLLRVTPARWGPVATGGFPPRLARSARPASVETSGAGPAMADWRHDRIRSEGRPSPLPAGRREALLWKLDGLSEYDIRRPMVPTGTNLLGLVKHVASVELGYFGETFGRPSGEPLPWLEDDAEPNADMWATADESREQIVGLYRRAWAHSDATIGALALDDIGHVPWWPEDRSEVTLHKILVHMIAETDRHAGQADIVRELIDGAAGLRADNDNMAPGDQAWWEGYRSRLERAAREAGPRGPVQGPAREAG